MKYNWLIRTNLYLTKSEERVFRILFSNIGSIVSRDQIAQSVWGNNWLNKYSDWQIDRLIYLLRRKIIPEYKIKTLRNSGYYLVKEGITIKGSRPSIDGVIPDETYLEYMNNPKNKRKVLRDLFFSLKRDGLLAQLRRRAKNILIVNSYSFDNVDNISTWSNKIFETPKITFSHFDERALNLHKQRINELGLSNIQIVYDDIRNSWFKDNLFDLVINDFRLNFNLNDKQNIDTAKNTYRILKPGARTIFSVVVDPRFESSKYGQNQELAPTNKDKPWHFAAEEGLTRNCFTLPYYKRLFVQNGFKLIKEFDIKSGKEWNPPYRRFLLSK